MTPAGIAKVVLDVLHFGEGLVGVVDLPVDVGGYHHTMPVFGGDVLVEQLQNIRGDVYHLDIPEVGNEGVEAARPDAEELPVAVESLDVLAEPEPQASLIRGIDHLDRPELFQQ